jgi:hypothetical protein
MYYDPSMLGRIELKDIWTRSPDLAGSGLHDEGAEIGPEIRTVCPFSLHDFVGEHFAFDEVLNRIRSPRLES